MKTAAVKTKETKKPLRKVTARKTVKVLGGVKKKGRANNVDAHVGSRLRMRRSLLGMSQENLADAVGITFQQVQKYERGANRVSASRLYQFSKILSVPVAFFFEQYTDTSRASGFYQKVGMAENDQAEFLKDDRIYDKESIELLRIYYSIENEKDRKDFLKIIRSMASKLK